MQEVLGLRYGVIVSAGGYGRNYRHLQWVLERFPDRFRGIVLARDDFRGTRPRRLDALGVRGIRFFAGPPGHEWSHLPTIDPRNAALVHELGWHVQYQSLVRCHIVTVADALLALPNRIVLDHFGGFDPALGLDQPAFRTLLRMLDTGRVWLKLSAPMRCADGDFPWDILRPFARTLVRHAPERLLWGSDWPHVQLIGRGMPNDGDLGGSAGRLGSGCRRTGADPRGEPTRALSLAGNLPATARYLAGPSRIADAAARTRYMMAT